jgi:hypothetical protein
VSPASFSSAMHLAWSGGTASRRQISREGGKNRMRWYRHFVLKKTDNAWGYGDAAYSLGPHTQGLDSSRAPHVSSQSRFDLHKISNGFTVHSTLKELLFQFKVLLRLTRKWTPRGSNIEDLTPKGQIRMSVCVTATRCRKRAAEQTPTADLRTLEGPGCSV